MDNSVFKANRITRTYCQTIHAPPEMVFPLLCPVREIDWLDGWRYAMLYSDSGLIEEGVVFSTALAGEEDTVWIVTKHDQPKGEIHFARFTHQSRTCVLKIAVRPKGEYSSYVDVSYT